MVDPFAVIIAVNCKTCRGGQVLKCFVFSRSASRLSFLESFFSGNSVWGYYRYWLGDYLSDASGRYARIFAKKQNIWGAHPVRRDFASCGYHHLLYQPHALFRAASRPDRHILYRGDSGSDLYPAERKQKKNSYRHHHRGRIRSKPLSDIPLNRADCFRHSTAEKMLRYQ